MQTDVSITCPNCQNSDTNRFLLIEKVTRYWSGLNLTKDGTLFVYTSTDEFDLDSGEGEQLECNVCRTIFDLPKNVQLNFVCD